MKYSDFFTLPSQDTSLEEKINIIKNNCKNSNLLRTKIKSLANLPRIVNPELTNISRQAEKTSSVCERCIDQEFQTILEQISNLDVENLNEEELQVLLLDIISPENLRFTTIIEKLKLSLYRDIIDYQKMLLQEKNVGERENILHEIEIIQTKIELIDDLDVTPEITLPDTTNDIFFLTTFNDNVIIYESLRKNVPLEYYPLFKELLLSVKNGQYKNLKKFKGFYEFYQVRYLKCRLIFSILGSGKILIIDAFLKKINSSPYYKSFLANRLHQYIYFKEYFTKNINDESFIQLHDKYYNDICNLLDTKKLSLGGGK